MSRRLLFESYATERIEVDGHATVRLVDPQLRDLSGPELAVHRVLLWHRNEETGQCNPAHERVAAETGYSPATVKRALVGLREKELWTAVGGRADRPGRGRSANSYEPGPNLTIRSNGPGGQADQQVNLKRPTGQIDPDQQVRLTQEQLQRNDHKGKSPKGEDQDSQPSDLVRRVCSILQGGVDSLDSNDFDRPWPAPKPRLVAAAITDEDGVDENIAIAAVTAAREIVQAQEKAPNISGLFASELRKGVEARRKAVHQTIADSIRTGTRDYSRYDAVVEPAQ